MIGVIAKTHERRAVEEFFELFKTPWEFYCKDQAYSGDHRQHRAIVGAFDADARLVNGLQFSATGGAGTWTVLGKRTRSCESRKRNFHCMARQDYLRLMPKRIFVLPVKGVARVLKLSRKTFRSCDSAMISFWRSSIF